MVVTKKTLVSAGIVLLIIVALWSAGSNRYLPYHESRVSRLHAEANELVDRSGDAIEQKLGDHPDSTAIRKAAEQYHAIKIEKAANDDAIDHGVKRCPAIDQYPGEKIGLDLRGCAVDQFVQIPLLDPWVEQRYEVSLYVFGQNGNLVPVAVKPVIRLSREKDPDSHSKAEEISAEGATSPVEYRLSGNVKFVPKGDAQYVEFTPIK